MTSDATTDNEIEFGPLQEGDPEQISSLIINMSDDNGLRLRDKSPAYYRWMYLENPAGPAVVHSAKLSGEIIASFAVAPKIFQVGGRRTMLGKTMDMFTNPDFQGKGLIKRCTTAVFEGAREAGMIGYYVTPSVNSYPIFTGRWGYQEPLRVVYRARILRFSPVLGAMLKPAGVGRLIGRVLDAIPLGRGRLRLPAGYSVAPMESFGPETDQLWERVARTYPVAQVRDASYLTWRYLANPDEYTIFRLTCAGELRGIVVLTETLRRGVPVTEVVDFVCPADDETTFRALIAVATDHARRQGHALIQAWSVLGTSLDARIRRSGLSMNRTDVKVLLSPELTDPLLSDPESWLLTQGDGNDV